MRDKTVCTYKALLRVVRQHVTSVAGNQQWEQHLRAEYRRPVEALSRAVDETSSADSGAAERRQLGEDYALLLNNVVRHTQLLASYNLGVDEGDRQKRMLAATARLVGFKLPNEER